MSRASLVRSLWGDVQGHPPLCNLCTAAAQHRLALPAAALQWGGDYRSCYPLSSSQSQRCSWGATRFPEWSGIDSAQDDFCLGFALITIHIFWRGSLTLHRRRKQAKFFSLKVDGMSEGTFAVDTICFHFATVWESAYSTSRGWLPSGAAATPTL